MSGPGGRAVDPRPVTLQVRGLRKEWPRAGAPALVAVDDVSFEVHAGEVFGLLGPNGSGKSTTLRMIATIVPPTAGTAEVGGRDVLGDPLGVRSRLGYLSASSGLPTRLLARECLELFAELQGARDPRAQAEEALHRFGIAAFADRSTDALSTGMRQRLRIACAAIADPPLLILDEPTAGLDIVAAAQLLDNIHDLRSRGSAIVFSTHIMSEAERLCDRIAVIYEGRLRAVGTKEELLASVSCGSLEEAFLAIVRAPA